MGCEGPETAKNPLFFQASPQFSLAQTEILRHPEQSQPLILPSEGAQQPPGVRGTTWSALAYRSPEAQSYPSSSKKPSGKWGWG